LAVTCAGTLTRPFLADYVCHRGARLRLVRSCDTAKEDHIRTALVAAGSAAVLAAGGIAIAMPAAASNPSHTLKFTAVRQKSVVFSPTTYGQSEKDVNAAGKIVGLDMLYGHFNVKQAGGVTFELSGGFITATLHLSAGKAEGKITNGTGKYKGVTGTVVGKELNKAGTRAAITITYH
jgi:hypothetical protein